MKNKTNLLVAAVAAVAALVTLVTLRAQQPGSATYPGTLGTITVGTPSRPLDGVFANAVITYSSNAAALVACSSTGWTNTSGFNVQVIVASGYPGGYMTNTVNGTAIPGNGISLVLQPGESIVTTSSNTPVVFRKPF